MSLLFEKHESLLGGNHIKSGFGSSGCDTGRSDSSRFRAQEPLLIYGYQLASLNSSLDDKTDDNRGQIFSFPVSIGITTNSVRKLEGFIFSLFYHIFLLS